MSELILTECSHCTTEVEESDVTSVSDGFEPYPQRIKVCQHCLDNYYTECDDCSEYVLNNELQQVQGGSHVCSNCLDNSYQQCDWCHCSVYNDEVRWLESAGDNVCERCWERYVRYCDGCAEPFHEDDINDYYCEGCQDDDRCDNYNYNGSFTYFKTVREPRYNGNLLYFGIELEVGSNETSNFYSLISEYSPRIVMLTDDCSIYDDDIQYGVELVSHPATFNWLRDNRFIWSNILRTFRRNNVQSFTTSTCGIHIHLSKNCFTHSHLYNFLKMVYENPKFTKLIGQRGKMGYRWCAIDNEDTPEQIAKKADDKRSWEKYTAVNLVRPETLEVRIFRGNLNERSFYKNIQYLHALFMFTKQYGRNVSELTIDNYLRYVSINKQQYIDLYEWLKEKGKINASTE